MRIVDRKTLRQVMGPRAKAAMALVVVVVAIVVAAVFAVRAPDLGFELPGSRRETVVSALDAALGATVEPLGPDTAASLGISARDKGLVITSIAENRPAARAGIRTGDVIERIDGAPVGSIGEAAAALADARAPDIILRVNRHGEYVIVHLPGRAAPVARDPAKQGGE
ncbi:MAG: serine protease Do [Sphingomonadales bacterium]|jgi:S1-C subfamily serine protease|nr:serine protease Do [Sphingomonadales bacterium]